MTDGKLGMIRDVLSWPVPPERKLAHIGQIVKEQAAGVIAPRVAKPRKRAKRVTNRTTLWRELKRVAPARAAQIGYTSATSDKLQKALARVRKGK